MAVFSKIFAAASAALITGSLAVKEERIPTKSMKIVQKHLRSGVLAAAEAVAAGGVAAAVQENVFVKV